MGDAPVQRVHLAGRLGRIARVLMAMTQGVFIG
jgi:hypothetical protein